LYQDDIPAPCLIPGSDGRLQIEWHINQLDVEIEVHQGVQEIIARRVNRRTDVEEEIVLQSDLSEIVPWMNSLVRLVAVPELKTAS